MKRSGLLSLVTCFALMSCARPSSDEDAILKLLEQGVQLAEEHNVKGLMKLATHDFVVEPGGQGRDETKRVLLWAFMRYKDFKVLHPRPQIDHQTEGGGEASARIPFLIVRKEQTLPNLKDLYEDPPGWLQEIGEHADLYRIELALINLEGDWFVRSAHLEGFTGLGFNDY